MRKKHEAIDYRHYRLSPSDILREGTKGVILAALVSYTFYKSLTLFAVLTPIAFVAVPLYRKKELLQKRNWELLIEFREGIWLMSGFMNAGLSAENALRKSVPELKKLYGERSMIAIEFSRIDKGLDVNLPMEKLFINFGQRSGVRDIENFAEVFALTKRSGGNMREVVEKTTDVIRDKTLVSEEIKNMTASRRYEQNIMNIIPFLIILYVNIATGDYLLSMYESLAGRLIMSVSLILIGVSYIVSRKILDIRL